ncbi:MAG: chemotaxis protein CheC [Myxococcales bacterium]
MREPQRSPLSAPQVDALRQLAGLGSADAVRSLGQLLGAAVEGAKVRSHRATRETLAQVLGAEGSGFAAHFTVEGGARLRVLIYFTVEGATLMAGLLLGTPLSDRSAIYSSALAEACNILVSSYVGGVGAGVGLTLVPSIPHLAIGVLDQAVAAAFGDLEAPLLLVTDLRLPGVRFAGRIVAAPEDEGLHRLLAGMGAA